MMNSRGESKKSFSIITLGCKLNQYESECIRQSLVRSNWLHRRFDEGADYYIINSCTVTGKTDSRCRNAIRRAKRVSPNAVIVVTGCYAETQPHNLVRMPEVDHVFGNRDKQALPGILNRMIDEHSNGVTHEKGTLDEPEERNAIVIDDFLDHSRAFIKIQEGCNSACSYCIIPRARGQSRSVPAGEVLDQIGILQENGFNEIVLTGIHIGRYGLDLSPENSLSGLLNTILEQTERVRIRLSSIEVNEITPRLLSLFSASDRIASHLHIPLQSGDDSILGAMNRNYDTAQFRSKIDGVVDACSGISVGTDIIVGFPGEHDEHFANTYAFVKELPLSYFHVFSFSKRPGTEASVMPGQVPPEVKKRRSKKLIRLGKLKKREFLQSRVGGVESALVQGPTHRFSRFSRSLTGNYCEVYIRCPSKLAGKLVAVRITHYSRGRLYGRTLHDGCSPGAGALGTIP